MEEESGGAFIFKKIKRKELNKQKKALSTQDEAGFPTGGVSSAPVGSLRWFGGLWLVLLVLLLCISRTVWGHRPKAEFNSHTQEQVKSFKINLDNSLSVSVFS